MNETQLNLNLAFMAYLSSLLFGRRIDGVLLKKIEKSLEAHRPAIGEWAVAWGPCTYRIARDGLPDNTMFAVEKDDGRSLTISIAGTNPLSLYGWLVEDFDVGQLYGWPHGHAPEDARVTEGTLRGLRALQQMVAFDRRLSGEPFPGANQSIHEFLRSWVGEREGRDSAGGRLKVTVTGHSLGGALAPALALWLEDTQSEWNPQGKAEVSCYAYAGATPGNRAFAEYITGRLGDRLHRVANRKDVVPHAWSLDDLVEVKALYTPELARDQTWDRVVALAVHKTGGTDFAQIARPEQTQILEGRVNEKLVDFVPILFAKYLAQVTYQHTMAYFDLLGVEAKADVMKATHHLNRRARNQLLLSRLPSPLRWFA